MSGPTIIISCCGSRYVLKHISTNAERGDVQPFIAAGQALKTQLNANVILLVTAEFFPFVSQHGLTPDLSSANVPSLLVSSPQGARLKKAGLMDGIAASRDFFKIIVSGLFQDTLNACSKYEPDLLILTTLPYFAGCSVIPSLLSKPCKVVIAHTVPSTPTSEFMPPTAGGFTSRFGFMNSLYWSIGESMAFGKIYHPLIQEEWAKHGITTNVNGQVGFVAPREKAQDVLYVYSDYLLPKPADWTDGETVTGFLQLTEAKYTPSSELSAFVENSKAPIVYVGLGSMLGFMFDSVEEQVAAQDLFIKGYNLLAQQHKVRMILHCVGNGIVVPSIAAEPKEDVYLLKEPVPHGWLFPKCNLVVHHGGAGSTQTSLALGKPTLILACGAQSDQVFWGELVSTKKLGPKSKLLCKMTAEKFCAKLLDGLFANSHEYNQNASALAEKMSTEDGLTKFVQACSRNLHVK